MDIELEDFIIKFQEHQNHHDASGELYLFVQSFLQNTTDAEVKKQMFLNLITKVPELFATLTNFKNAAISLNLPTSSEKDLKTLNLKGATFCLKTLLMCLNHSETQEQLQNLLHTIINILYQSYTHCKESEALYGDLLEDFTDQLANFLQEIQVVQNAMLSVLDHIITLNLSDSEVVSLLTISGDIGNLCELVFSLDTALAVCLWRIFMKVITKYPELSQQKIKVDSILSSLVSEVISIVDEYKFKMENEESVEESDIKIFLFLTNLVMKIYKIFHSCIKSSFNNIIQLALKLSNLLILSYSPLVLDENTPSHLKIAVRNIVKAVIPLFYSDSSFQIALQQLDDTEFTPDLQMACVLLKLSALDLMLYDKSFMKVQNTKEFFKHILFILQSNKPLDDIKLVSIKIPHAIFRNSENTETNNEKLVSIYLHAYLHLSKYSKMIPDSEFGNMESDMLEMLVSSSELVSLLISDIWIYRLRCSSLEFLYNRIVSLLKKFPQHQFNFRYKHLINRILKFFPSGTLVKLSKENRVLKHFVLREKVLHRYGTPEISSLSSRDNKRENSKNFKTISLLMNDLRTPILEDEKLITKACCLLELFSLFVNISQNTDILKFTELAKYFFSLEIYKIQIAVLTFLKAFKGKILEEKDVEFKRIVNLLATLLAETLQCKNYLVKYEAFHTFAGLAQYPSLVKVCRQTIVVAPSLATNIKLYFAKEPLNGFLTEKERMETMQKQLYNTIRQPEITDNIKKLLLPLKAI